MRFSSRNGIIFTTLLGLSQAALAACPQDGATPFAAAPADPVNGFATYVQDSEGLALELCLTGDGAGICFFDPAIPNNAFSQLIGFGPEAFWWLAEGTVATTRVDALMVMAAEAAWVAEIPGPGDQFPFTRLRIRIDTTDPGIYTLTHPYGQETWTITTPGVNAVNESFDIPFIPGQKNQGRVGPWLTSVGGPFPDPNGGPGSFIGNGTPLPAVGSPCGTNFLRLTATALNGVTPLDIDPADQDADGRTDSVSSNLFTVFGKHYTGTVQTPLAAAANFSRAADGSGRINVFANAPTTAALTATVGAAPTTMARDGDRYFVSLSLAAGTTPAVSVTAVNNPPLANNLDSTASPAATDVVTITRAEATCTGTAPARACTLVVEASSSDLSGAAALTGTGSFPGLTVVPATVTVTSTGGGLDTEPVKVINTVVNP